MHDAGVEAERLRDRATAATLYSQATELADAELAEHWAIHCRNHWANSLMHQQRLREALLVVAPLLDEDKMRAALALAAPGPEGFTPAEDAIVSVALYLGICVRLPVGIGTIEKIKGDLKRWCGSLPPESETKDAVHILMAFKLEIYLKDLQGKFAEAHDLALECRLRHPDWAKEAVISTAFLVDDLTSAEKYLEEFEGSLDRDDLLKFRGRVAWLRGDLSSALELYREAVAESERASDPAERVAPYRDYIRVLLTLGKSSDSREYLARVLSMRTSESLFEVLNTYGALASFYVAELCLEGNHPIPDFVRPSQWRIYADLKTELQTASFTPNLRKIERAEKRARSATKRCLALAEIADDLLNVSFYVPEFQANMDTLKNMAARIKASAVNS